MSDVRFFSAVGAAALGLILLALVFPQGEGARSPRPFGHQTAAQREAWKKAHAPKVAPDANKPRPAF
jgi:hypothetical protein